MKQLVPLFLLLLLFLFILLLFLLLVTWWYCQHARKAVDCNLFCSFPLLQSLFHCGPSPTTHTVMSFIPLVR